MQLCGIIPCRNGEGEALVAAANVSHKPAAGCALERTISGDALPVEADKDRVVPVAAFIQSSGLDAVINQGAVYAGQAGVRHRTPLRFCHDKFGGRYE